MTKENKTIESKTVVHRSFNGVVLSVVENKTIHVLVKTKKMHLKYRKQFVSTKKYAVHDEANIAKVGDKVIFEECRPISKTKKWRLLEVVKSK